MLLVLLVLLMVLMQMLVLFVLLVVLVVLMVLVVLVVLVLMQLFVLLVVRLLLLLLLLVLLMELLVQFLLLVVVLLLLHLLLAWCRRCTVLRMRPPQPMPLLLQRPCLRNRAPPSYRATHLPFALFTADVSFVYKIEKALLQRFLSFSCRGISMVNEGLVLVHIIGIAGDPKIAENSSK